MTRTFPLTFAILALASCDVVAPGTACTEIGCSDQVTLQFVDGDGNPVTDLVATITAGADTIEVDCASDPDNTEVDCADAIVYVRTAPETMSVTATSPEGDFTGDLTPEYTIETPNGPDCPPECAMAVEIITVQ